MAGKRTVARAGTRVGAKIAPVAGKAAGKTAWKLGKAEAKLIRHALRSREPRGARFFKYGLFALGGFALGAVVAKLAGDNNSSSYSDTATGVHGPAPDSPAARRGETWGSGTTVGTAGGGAGSHQRPADVNRTGGERDYSDPSSGPLIGERHGRGAGDVGEQQEEIENRIRTRVGEDARTAGAPRINVEVNDGVAELRGPAASEEVKEAVGEIAAGVEGVREVRNLLTVS